ncbi:PPR domain-containing protein/PPR_1 domain-containing protein/PPR_2 domain-containing protein [Cephalotus follicularis]|uniref:PPR domain-containing protein/PPR_1 domain-containing protein/PPR_2 domain-containing protein n=1 Tax=Cephalotus follicularis TaxID=3775 RepID=A0A1Q3C5J6_CEPFO|nr:PPR domain-containing protein/PPR_1 domain-containing protein/PPR_2 domain-containing protein [Cephalotus follicularis]
MMNQLKQIHAYTLRNGINHTKTLIVKILQISNIPYAHKLFNQIPQPTIFLYNKLIKAYSSLKQHHQCLSLYVQMCLKGCPPNQYSFTFLFAACASLNSPILGQILHTHFVKSGFESDVFALTALVDMYAKLGMLKFSRQLFDETPVRDVPTWNSIIAGYSKCGNMEEALKLFKKMPERNVVSWTALISGYSQNGQYAKALHVFLRMEKEKGVKPNEVTIASVLPACTNLGALEVGQRIEAHARENGFFKNLYVCNAMLEMLSRCGEIEIARQMFDEIGRRRNLCSWNSMIMGFAVHGRCNEVLELYNQMLGEGFTPDDVTFVGLLLACTHGGMVVKGWQLFESMETIFHITPKLEHYGCMVDLLGRAGELKEAYDLIQSMPMKPDSVVWGALLGACSFYNNVEIAEKAAGFLFDLEPSNPGNYVILSNIYASAGRWDGVVRLRKVMKSGKITKAAGYSSIEEGGEIHKFVVEDKSHPRCPEIYELLDEVTEKMKPEEMKLILSLSLRNYA